MSRRFVCLLFLSLLLSFTINVANAAEVEVVTEYMEPFQLKNSDGSLGGYATEVVQAIFELSGDHPTILVLPWARAYKRALDNKNVLIFSIARTAEREALFSWIGALASEHYHVWGLREKFPDNTNELDRLREHTFVTTLSSTPKNILSAAGLTLLFAVSSQEQVLQMLIKNRADFTVSTPSFMRYQTNVLGLGPDFISDVYEFKHEKSELYIALNANSDTSMVKKYQQVFKALQENGLLTKLKSKWHIANSK